MPSSSDGNNRVKSRKNSRQNQYPPYVPRATPKSNSTANTPRATSGYTPSSYSSVGAKSRSDDKLSYTPRSFESNSADSSTHPSSNAVSNDETLPPISSLPKIGRVQRDTCSKNSSDQDRILKLRLEIEKQDATIQKLREMIAAREDKDTKMKNQVHGTSLVTSSAYTENLKLLTDMRRRLETVQRERSENQYSIDRLQASLLKESSDKSSLPDLTPLSSKKVNPLAVDSIRFINNQASETDDLPQVEDRTDVEFFDISDHWCEQCDSFSPNLTDYLLHLQSKQHFDTTPEDRTRPWPIKKRPSQYDPERNLRPVLGSQFLVPCKAFYCVLCRTFLGDNECATEHIFSLNHNKNAIALESSQPEYKKVFEKDKSAALAKRDAEERKKKRIADERAIEEQKKIAAAVQEEEARRNREAAEKARNEEAQKKLEQTEKMKRLEAEKQALLEVKPLKKSAKTYSKPTKKDTPQIKSSPAVTPAPKETSKRKRSKGSKDEVTPQEHRSKKKTKSEDPVASVRECHVVITSDDQKACLKYVQEAKLFKYGKQIHRYDDATAKWVTQSDPSVPETFDVSQWNNLNDQTATDDEAFETNEAFDQCSNDPMLKPSVHDEVLNALEKVVKSCRPRNSSDSMNDSTRYYGMNNVSFERPSTPTSKEAASPNFNSSPCTIITGCDVILSKQCSIDGGSITSGGLDEQIDPPDDVDFNLEIPQLNLDVLANDE